MAKKENKQYLQMLPYASVALYMGGLFLLVLGRTLIGFLCVAVGAITGITTGVLTFKKRYKPSRQTHPKWMRFFGINNKA
ncbi:MAG: hypothetical protein KJ995_01375 [Candidatus Omnitrophica bacterium]|nr:hypothetical protein [Candidatus Omnitrophota bacterium]MBU1128291.1 hypothetical protein [Candidatus Omnitrophota bacterium]MBU1656912.1 hypothetical protein [Candidatus Omnitrophota bacterium]MBU1851041.1 hypothetical protein [Candidatus Omnitrophota bacterium]